MSEEQIVGLIYALGVIWQVLMVITMSILLYWAVQSARKANKR